MSTPFYDLASLVIQPSGVKAQKVYAQKPMTTDGQLTFSRASTATRVNSAGLIEAVASDVPRLDYLGSSCPRLLLEPQRTNFATNSETITASTGTTVSLNNAASPDGYVNADKLVEDTSTGTHLTGFGAFLGGSVDSSPYVVSVFAKASGRTRIQFFDNNQASGGLSDFDLANGVVISGSGKIENYGNGWYRCIIFPIKDNSTTSNCQIRLISTGNTTSYTGDGTSGALLWGRQIEVGTYATSYIPTLGSASTRGSDAASKTGISSLIGQSEGTLFVDCESFATGTTNVLFMLADGTTNNRVEFYWTGTNSGNFVCSSGGAIQFNIALTLTQAQRNKIAVVYKANDFAVYANGVSIASSSGGSVPSSLSSLEFSEGAPYLYMGKINQALLFKTRLSNAQLAELTTL